MAALESVCRPDTEVDEEFLAIVCSDAELLDAEFEAIVAGAWPPAHAPRGAAPLRPADPDRSAAPGTARDVLDAAPARVRQQPTGRERSPPFGRTRPSAM